jgi:putative MATE family efflux protein
MVSQNLLNLVDTAMVGTLGKVSLAAVGLGGFATFTSQAIILGLSAGVQAMAARRKGEGLEDEMAVPLNGGLALSLLIGLPLSMLLYWLAPVIFPLLNSDPQVVAAGIPYYRMRLIGVAAVGMNFAFRGYWNGVNLSRLYMRTLVIMHLANVFLSYGLIFGRCGLPRMGTAGAGLGTTCSVILGTLIYLYLGLRHARKAGFLQRLPDRRNLRSLLQLSIPNAIQQVFFASGLTTLYWIVGKVGTTELAAANVLINITLVALLPSIGLGMAAASLVGQALGKGEPEDAARWGWDVVRVGVVLLTGLGIPYILIPQKLLGVFLRDADTLAVAIPALRLVGATVPVEAFGMVLMNALLGAGDNRNVMLVSVVTQWIFFLPVAYLVGPKLGYGLLGIWSAQAVYRSLQTLCFVQLWRRGKWKGIQV